MTTSGRLRLEPHVEALLSERYYLKGDGGEVAEDWLAMCERVSRILSGGNEDLRSRALEAMAKREIIMASPTLMNAGARVGMLSSCFIYPIRDSMEGIFAEALWLTARTFQLGGGVGISFTPLRPAGSVVKTTGGKASGPGSFLKNFHVTGDTVSGGGLRKAAQLAALAGWHPDVEDFASIKANAQRQGNAHELEMMNLSVSLADNFFRALSLERTHPDAWFRSPDDEEHSPNDWQQCDAPADGLPTDRARRGRDGLWVLWWKGKVYKAMRSSDLLRLIAEEAHYCGCPGLIFSDSVNRYNYVPNVGRIRNPNPCGEFYGPLYATCNLASLNLNAFCRRKGSSGWDWDFDMRALEDRTRMLARLLDRVITENKLPCQESTNVTLATRPVGLGVFAVANALVRLGMAYSSEDARNWVSGVLERISFWSMDESVAIAKEHRGKDGERRLKKGTPPIASGETDDPSPAWSSPFEKITEPWPKDSPFSGSFPAFEGSAWNLEGVDLEKKGAQYQPRDYYESQLRRRNPFAADMIAHGSLPLNEWLRLFRKIQEGGIRNCHTTFMMPTGSVSFICDSGESSGIEPLTTIKPGKRRVAQTNAKGGTVLEEVVLDYPAVVAEYAEYVLGIQQGDLRSGSKKVEAGQLPPFFETALDVSPDAHVRMLAAAQRFVHNGISKTINMPEHATVEDVMAVYELAYKMGCRGVTVYRDHSKPVQIVDLQTGATNKRLIPKAPRKVPLAAREDARVFRLSDPDAHSIGNGDSKLYVTATILRDEDGRDWPIELFCKFDQEAKEAMRPAAKLRNLAFILTSNMLRHGIGIPEIVRAYERAAGSPGDFPAQVAKLLREMYAEALAGVEDGDLSREDLDTARPRCGNAGCDGRLVFREGCYSCPVCGSSRC